MTPAPVVAVARAAARPLTARCVRCGTRLAVHADVPDLAGIPGLCPGWVGPAPWWLRALTRVLARLRLT